MTCAIIWQAAQERSCCPIDQSGARGTGTAADDIRQLSGRTMRLCNAQLAGSKRILWITLASILLLRLLTLGAYPLVDRTEALYALIAKLMVQSGNWITPMLEPGVPYLGKPPLSFWANAA